MVLEYTCWLDAVLICGMYDIEAAASIAYFKALTCLEIGSVKTSVTAQVNRAAQFYGWPVLQSPPIK
jgi:hypothetical protein